MLRTAKDWRKNPLSITENSHRLGSFFMLLALAAFSLNWLWEMVQMSAYAEMAESSWRETALLCARASLGDVAMTFGIYGLGALAAGRLRWGMEGKWNVYAAAALLGAVFAAAFEWKALSSGRWSYTSQMPIVAVLGVGLWPLFQLVLLVPVSFTIAVWWAGRPSSDLAPDSTDGDGRK